MGNITRKGQLVQHQLILIIILLITFFVLFGFVLLMITRSHQASVSETCRLGLASAAKTNTDIKCKPAIFTVSQAEIKEDEIVSTDKIKNILAKEMAGCWRTVSKGEFGPRIFGASGTDHDKCGEFSAHCDLPEELSPSYCLICTVLNFDEVTSGQVRAVTDFSNYLRETEDTLLRQKYHDYMDGHYTVSDQVDITKPIAVVWLYKTAGAGESSILLAGYDSLVGTCDTMVN